MGTEKWPFYSGVKDATLHQLNKNGSATFVVSVDLQSISPSKRTDKLSISSANRVK
jgi:hypothetical protein